MSTAVPTSEDHRLVAVLLVAAGVAVAADVAWPQNDSRAAPAVTDQHSRQEPQAPQQPQVDAKVQSEVERLVRNLELPDLRGPAIAALEQLGTQILPLLRTALAAEQKRGRPEVLAALQQALMLAQSAAAKKAFGLPLGELTLVSDYSDNKVVCLDAKGKEVYVLTDVYGVWDTELTPQGTLLVTEFSVSRVREIDRTGTTLWEFADLKNPYRATRLPSGNTLISDTFNGRLIEVNAKKEVVWKFATGIRPYGAERLANGNTLIADASNARVIEVTAAGEVVWEVKEMRQVHDAKRLPDGNTLITLRLKGQVLEVDPKGNTVWQLDTLNSPSDALRLPSGNTLVAENNQVREFDPKGNEVGKQRMTWAVSVKRY
jgi:outer membrane protein assembly factor BamB